MTDISNHWAQGWAFFKSGGKGFVPNEDDPELIEWVKGFGAAMSDYDLDRQHPSIQVALLHYGITALMLTCSRNAWTQPKQSLGNRNSAAGLQCRCGVMAKGILGPDRLLWLYRRRRMMIIRRVTARNCHSLMLRG
ncbi:MAG: hypothetical protein Q8K07_07615 [Methylicorpusculum sp.]|uniref:hypothetical protein n=1 Tax=Methylicorpusculum sp. TaxID=2713644 RepID=UPI002731A8B0|nr:hypothetical protein [Methylicorpusculum sp.]MDP2201869.1 hypothetical protein [Methylicorpusculum sp.]